MTTNEMNRDEVMEFGAKLDAFGQQLSPKEQELLATILLRAAHAPSDDVVGYDFGSWTNPEKQHTWQNPYAGAGASHVSGQTTGPYQPVTPTFHFVDYVCPAVGLSSSDDSYKTYSEG
jgi:hypothetical protein